jgi:preprotein translocase subunit YajC
MNIFERFGKLDRRWVFLLLAIVVVITLLIPFATPIRVNPEVRSIHTFIESLKPGDYVQLAIDYDPNALAELHPMSYAIMEQVMAKDVRIVMTCLSQNGPAMAEKVMHDVIDSVKQYHQKEIVYGRDIVFLGYKPYYAIVILGMGENYRLPFPTDYYNTPVDSIPVMHGIQNYDQVKAVICISGSNIIDSWIADGNARYGVEVAIGTTGVMAADFYPYLKSGQIFGLMGGMLGAAEYETLVAPTRHNRMAGPAMEAMRVQVWAHMVIILFIVLGNIGFFISRRQKERMSI